MGKGIAIRIAIMIAIRIAIVGNAQTCDASKGSISPCFTKWKCRISVTRSTITVMT